MAMYFPQILETAIGLCFLFLALSLAATALNEWIAQLLSIRSKSLYRTIQAWFAEGKVNGEEEAARFYAHPLIKSLRPIGADGVPRNPSFIPSKQFALALLDFVHEKAAMESEQAAGEEDEQEGDGLPRMDVARTLAALEKAALPDELKKTLKILLHRAGDDFNEAVANVGEWFDNGMDRLSGWYKRRASHWQFGLGLLMALALNADTFQISRELWANPVLRHEVAARAEAMAENGLPADDAYEASKTQLEALPLGWFEPGRDGEDDEWAFKAPGDGWDWLVKILGLLTTGFLISLGGPFWFDAMEKLLKLRAAGPKPERARS